MKKLITSLALVLSALSSYAITPLWMRDARISPDGSEIVFCHPCNKKKFLINTVIYVNNASTKE